MNGARGRQGRGEGEGVKTGDNQRSHLNVNVCVTAHLRRRRGPRSLGAYLQGHCTLSTPVSVKLLHASRSCITLTKHGVVKGAERENCFFGSDEAMKAQRQMSAERSQQMKEGHLRRAATSWHFAASRKRGIKQTQANPTGRIAHNVHFPIPPNASMQLCKIGADVMSAVTFKPSLATTPSQTSV